MRVCHLITGLGVGGAENALVRLCRGLAAMGYEQRVLVMLPPGPLAGELERSGIPVRSLRMRAGLPDPLGLIRLLRELRAFRPDVLQTWMYHADLLGAVARPFAPPLRLVWNLRNSEMHDDRRLRIGALVRALTLLSGVPDAVVANAAAGQADHARFGYRPRRWACIPNGVDTDRFRPLPDQRAALRAALGVAPDGPVIGMVARRHKQKDHPTFLDAARLFRQTRPDARFVLAGLGCEPGAEPMAGMIRARGLEGSVSLLGVRADLPRIYPAFDLACLSSAFGEGTPNVLIEALACGIPCVATDVGDSRQVVGPCGRIVPPGDPAALAAAWGEVLGLDLAAAARARAVTMFAESAVCAAYDALYRSLRPNDVARPAASPVASAGR